MSFFLRGTYNFEGRKNPEVGIIEISELEEITGDIMDFQSVISRYEVYGNFCHDEKRVPMLVFLKMPFDEKDIAKRYILKKSDKKESIQGEYQGVYERISKYAVRLGTDFHRSIGEFSFVKMMNESANKVKITLDSII